MKCHTKQHPGGKDAVERVALIGTPNVGKSVIFGLLTGKYATVSNYPGTTVEVAYGNIEEAGIKFLIVDTPGANSLLPMSEDEQVTRDILLRERPAHVVQVADSKNLRRALSITAQLAEMGLPTTLALNMADESMDRGIYIDTEKLSKLLGITVISTVAPERRGISELREAIGKGAKCAPMMEVKYEPVVEKYIEKVSELLPESPILKRSIALMVLAGDETLKEWLRASLDPAAVEKVEALRHECEKGLGRSVSLSINHSRMTASAALADQVTEREPSARPSWTVTLGKLSTHPIWGIPILLVVLYGIYQFVGVLGADILVGFVEETLFGEHINPALTSLINAAIPFQLVRDMLVGDYGIITMAVTYAIGIILPITGTFFIAFSVLEDSGYLPRLGIMSDRFFRMMGLSGKAVLPMVLGLGCGTMAVMTTRVLETKRDRIIATFLLALAVPCAAQLGVILGLVGGLSGKAMAFWVATLTVILLATGWLASKIVPGERADFCLEIPPMRVPRLGNILVKTGHRVLWYLREAVPLFIIGTLALFALDKAHVLTYIERMASPVIVGILDLPREATGAFLIGFFRRDYGAAGLYDLAKDGLLDPTQIVVSLVTLTLFVPCLAHFLMMIKERGMQAALIMTAVIVPLAITVGGTVNLIIRGFGITF